MRSACLAVLLLAAASCSREAAPAAEVPREESPRGEVPRTGLAAFFETGPVELPGDREGLRRMLGEPDSVRVAAQPNIHHASVTDSILTLHYPGLAVEVYRAGYDGKEMLVSLVIADDRYLQPASPLRLGASEEAVRRVLGEPTSAGAGTLEYVCDECLVAGQETVTFAVEQGVVRRVEVRYWID